MDGGGEGRVTRGEEHSTAQHSQDCQLLTHAADRGDTRSFGVAAGLRGHAQASRSRRQDLRAQSAVSCG